jgi:hypothetical protein
LRLRRRRRSASARLLLACGLGLVALASLAVPAAAVARAATAPLQSAAGAPALPSPLFGVTLDELRRLPETLTALQSLPQRADVRVYLSARAGARSYAAPVARIAGVASVMAELLDSSEETRVSTEAFQALVQSYLQALAGSVAIWEVGNEVNGNWTGPYEVVESKLSEAYADVAAAGGVSALTLYANNFGPDHCGDGEAELTPLQFSERYVPAAVADGLDYVLLSYYPTECGGREPSYAEVRAYMEALHALYPHALLGFGEVGLPRRATHKTLAQAAQIMRWAYALAPGLPYYAGGYFWWYAAEDALRAHALLSEPLAQAFEAEAAALP